MAPAPSWEVFPAGSKDLFKAFRTPEVGWDLIVNQICSSRSFCRQGWSEHCPRRR